MSLESSNRAGRPREIDEVKRGEICALLSVGCSYRTAAQYVGCTAAAISMLTKRDAAFAAQVAKAVAQREVTLLSYLRRSAKKSWRATAYMLEMTVGGRYGGRVLSLDEEVENERLEAAFSRARDVDEPGPVEQGLGVGDWGLGEMNSPVCEAESAGVSAGPRAEVATCADEKPAVESEGEASCTGADAGPAAADGDLRWGVWHGQETVPNQEETVPHRGDAAPAAGAARDARASAGRGSARSVTPRASGAPKKEDREIQLSMDVLEKLWKLQEQLEDEKFFDADGEET